MTMGQKIIEKGSEVMQSFKPIKHMSQHVCTFALYSHDLGRQLETHHYISRLTEDFLQAAVYDSDQPNARLLGVEYILSDRLYEGLPAEEQKLWHSHAYEVKTGLWIHPELPEMVARPELESLAKTYGKFWCTWQVDRGDRLPLGAPALMMSPQGVALGKVKEELVEKRDQKYNISREALEEKRVEIAEPEWINPQADYWKQNGKGFAIDIRPAEMKLRAPFP